MERVSFYLLIFLFSSRVSGQYKVPAYLKSKYGNNLSVSPSPSYPQSGVKTSHVKTKTASSLSHGYVSGLPPDPINPNSYGPAPSPPSGGNSFRGGCTSRPPPILNAGMRCSVYSGCRANCLVGHQFPNGANQIYIICENGEWKYEGGLWGQGLSCQPQCDPPCQNNGICLAPNQCNCPQHYSGPQCQFEDKPCMNYPPLSMNARRQCNSKFCTISCMEGYQFPDGTALATMACKNGFWIPSREKWNSIPDCEAICSPPCLNGGNCLSFGYCQCPQDFRGPQCQYRTDNCGAKKLRFNGGYNCSGDSIGLSCSIHCPVGMEFEFKPSSTYYCRYQDGFFVPANIPQCISNNPVQVTSSHSYHNYFENTSSFNLQSLLVNGIPERENIWDANQYKHELPGKDIFGHDLSIVTLNPQDSNVLGIKIQKLPKPGICFTWQGSHYKTFDGRVFSFDSKCAHTLVRDSVDNTFSIIILNDPKCKKNVPSDCSKIIKIYFDKKEYILQRSIEGLPTFSTPKKKLPIPGQLPGLRIEMSAHFIILSLDTVGAKLKWDTQQHVQVEVKENLWNRTEGLCGRIDGDDSNDFLNKDGHKPQTVSNLATSWKVEDLEHECNDLPSEEHKCQDSKNEQATTFCQKLFDDKRFASCRGIIEIPPLLDACRWDYCSCQDEDPTTCACETFNVFVRTCTHLGVKNLMSWRDEKTCPMRCSGGRTYKSCGPSGGQPVCGASTEEIEDEANAEGCVEGCYCPEGTVLHENRCITRDECPCKLRTKIFPPGTEVPKDCNTCTCNGGKWICTQVSCGARCAAVGDPHYSTFDGKKYDFMGQCSYYLVKTSTFSIEAENVACAGAISQAMNLPASITSGLPSCTRAVTLKISGQIIKLKQNHDIVINGQDISKVPYNIANVTIRSVSSIFLQVDLPNGIQIWWDGVTRVYIDIPANFPEKTQGLCGTFNNNQKDDFLTPEGDIEAAIIPFANKWKTSEKCNDVPDILKSHPCSANIHNQPLAEKHCQNLRSNLFSPCHFFVDPEPFYQDCLYDMCSCEYKISKCLCPTLAAYAEECSRKGIKIEWRDSVRECGVHCPNGQKYQICGNSCTRTCRDIALRPDCKPQCVEGCNCPEGEALNDEGECVPVGECNCHFDGLQFHAGYKEVRPASKGPHLCTCINAQWSCRPATPEEKKKFPQASDFKSLCSASENMEFTTCEPAEPVTCKNMHNPDYYSASVCHPGCKCKENYVLDTSTKKCVKPSECPCHHGGRSYKENATVQNDCNTCQCQNGKWTCTDRPCSAICSAWGDSHFKTFDGKHYDFQGQCDYALAKGLLETDSFDISIQNVPCGSLGTSCSKSVTIRIKSSEDQDSITLTRDKSLPNYEEMKHTTVRQRGLYVIVEAPDLGLVIQWDKGTRVYVKVDPRWKDRIKGLCGNYNNNQDDDFQTPSGGFTEVSAKIFGDSWKLQSYCPEASEITDTCEDRPDRKVWALKQCGILKSSLFSPCHSEVPVDIYLEKCIFDACACDEGGDCECLCTALAAYAQECNNRGVPIKWRSQKLCPMQCDERCSNYSPCISTCPVETCDNFLTHSKISKSCKEDSCIEGCAPKPCQPDQIYINSSFLECVPRNICKPACLEIDEVTYYEGDLIEEDECHSCFCSRGQKICKGQPCTEVFTTIAPVASTHQMEEITKCESGWSQWINHDVAKPTKTKIRRKKTDHEPIPTSLLLNNLKGGKCSKAQIVNIECRTVKTHLTPKQTGLDVECSLENGLICKSSQKGKYCQDFEIRVLCECEKTPEPCDPLKPHKEHPTDCHIFYHCEPSLQGPHYVEKTCGPSMYYNPVSMVCDWPYAVAEIKPECRNITRVEEKVELPSEVKTHQEQLGYVPDIIESTIGEEEIVQPTEELCPIGTKAECAIQCDNLCLFYSSILRANDFCKDDEQCVPGCVKPGQNSTCPQGMMWANNETCVALHDCLCRSNDGKPVKPGATYRESDCRVCQCVDNTYYCDESSCHTTPKDEGRSLLPAARPEGGKIGLPLATTKSPSPEDKTGTDQIPILSTVTPPEKCDEDNFIDLVQGNQPLPDEAFNASSVLSSAFKPEYARFTVKAEGKSGGSWAPAYSNTYQYLEIDLGQQEPIYGVKVKGSPLYDEYVTSYKVTYSPDGKNFLSVLNKNRLPQTFRGSVDSRTPVQQIFETPFEAKIVRIHPQTWHMGISLKVELIGCGEPPTTTTVLYEFITPGLLTTIATPMMCDDTMGLDDGLMSDQQISVSSELDSNHSRTNLKLSDDEGWQPLTNSPTEFIEFDFMDTRNLTGLETKGGPNGWVTAFTLKYSHDGKEWNQMLDKKSSKERIFLGNFDSDSPQINNFDLPISARYLKLIPNKWHGNIQMRVEIHGCYEPYPTIEELVSTTPLPSSCNNCPGITAEPLELHACRCPKEKWWDGENCVTRTECPCVIGHISYAIGTVYEKEDCLECICKLGGVSYCNPKQCNPCEKGLRSTVTTTCKCTCQPCPTGTTLCPTSNICINTTLWCNGIRDCPDDETGCTTTIEPTTTPITEAVEECPVIECPKGYKKQLKGSKATKYLSPMFSQKERHVKTSYYTGIKNVKSNYRKANLPRPTNEASKVSITKTCPEYRCISAKPPPKYIRAKKECPPVSCPLNYIPVFEEEAIKTYKECPRYTCYPPPPPDAVCNVTGRTFNTFDEMEYKYDICNHILARDLDESEWEIGLKKNCTEFCYRNLIVHLQDHQFILHPDLTVEYDGFRYTISQTRKIGSHTQAFSISRLGNTLLFVSNRYGFWIIWDKLGDVRMGVVRKLVGKVDGLCGFFNENPDDDKRKPDGSLARTTVDFGDSWLAEASDCETKTCPPELQELAWKACRVKDQVLEPCSKIVNIDAFVSRCVETTCECLQAAGKNKTAQEECRCDALESLVVDCLTADASIDLSDWRMRLDCPVTCEAPFVYHDCYQRKCEPTCESITDPNVCPKIPHVCFPGCYCPPGFVKKEETCIKPSSCRDCECNVLPHLQYVTYDEKNFSLNANCVYVMSRDALLKGSNHKFQVLITNAPCKNNEQKTCVGKVTILYEGRKIHVLHDAFRRNLKLIVDGERIDDFGEIKQWCEVHETPTKHLKILLTDVQVEVSIYYPSLGVSVKAPSHKYGGKLEGLCGDCNEDPEDDFRTPSGTITEDSNEFALSWLYDKLPGGQSKEMCQNKPENCTPLHPDTDPCNLLIDYKTFGQCLRVLDPSLFLDWCKKDTCDNHPEFACTAIEAYARDCANAGFCIDWRTNMCPAQECPSDQIYNPCGTKCPKTCDSIKTKEKSCSNKPVEGCFCPEGKVLRNGTCVFEKDCEVCDEEGHHPGDEWKKDKCTRCTCDGSSLKCETQHCSGADKICEQGYQAVKVPGKEDECCDKYACVPEPTAGPTCETPQPISCGAGQIMKLSPKLNGCQHFICECKPVEECEPMDTSLKHLEDGYVETVDKSGCCPEVKIICKPELCPKPKPCPQYHTLKNQTTSKCCPLYSCEPPKDKCIYENKYVAAEIGGERERTENERQKVLKNANETWQDGPCHTCRCSLSSIGNYQSECAQTDCTMIAISEDHLDYDFNIGFVYDQCCPEIKRIACKHNEKIHKTGETWIDENDPCITYKCLNTSEGIRKETKITNCDTNCEKGFEYVPARNDSGQCCGTCKPYACVVAEKVYEIGSEWQSEDYCTNYKCIKIDGTVQVQSQKVNCPELPKDLIDDFIFETVPVEGKCCKKHKTTACKVNGQAYQIGETWPSPDGNKCKKFTCLQNDKQEITKQESVETCKTDCSIGWEYKESKDSCCGECVQIACVVNGTLKKPGETWKSLDNCTTFICEHFDGQFIVSSNQESCPSIENCPEENIYVKNCCKFCNITSDAQKMCTAEAISLNKTIGLLKTHRGVHGVCKNEKPIHSFTECIGTCRSSTMFNFVKGFHESVCSCCQATNYRSIEVDLECEDGYILKKKVAVPSECGCEGCAAAKKMTKTASAPVKGF